MSKRSKIVVVRIQDAMYEEMTKAMESRNRQSRDEPLLMSSFIRYCIRTKIDHMKRGRSSGRKAAKAKKAGMAVKS